MALATEDLTCPLLGSKILTLALLGVATLMPLFLALCQMPFVHDEAILVHSCTRRAVAKHIVIMHRARSVLKGVVVESGLFFPSSMPWKSAHFHYRVLLPPSLFCCSIVGVELRQQAATLTALELLHSG